MRGLKPEMIPRLAIRDVNIVKREARFIIKLPELKVIENPRPRLGVIAIIGPGKYLGMRYGEVELDEIGIGKTYPWHRAQRPKSLLTDGEIETIPDRHPWFSLSEDQYILVAPVVFELIQRITNRQTEQRKSGENGYMIDIGWARYFRYHGKLEAQKSRKNFLRGKRFSVSFKSRFLPDVYWAELNLNWIIQKHSQRIIRQVYNCFSRYQTLPRRDFSKLAATRNSLKLIAGSSLCNARYLLAEAFARYPHKKTPFFSHIASLVSQNAGVSRERHLADAALKLPGSPRARLNGIQLEVTTGLFGSKFNAYHASKYKKARPRDYIVFEVFHSSQKNEPNSFTLLFFKKEAQYVMPDDVNKGDSECFLTV